MDQMDVYKHYHALWHRAKNLPENKVLSVSMMRNWLSERSLEATCIEEISLRDSIGTRVIAVTSYGCRGYFPIDDLFANPDWRAKNEAAILKAEKLDYLEWFYPLWVSHEQVSLFLNDRIIYSRQSALKTFEYHTSTIYTLPFQAVCIEQLMTASSSLKGFNVIAREAFIGFYSGFQSSSISALIPIVEGVITKILSGVGTDLSIYDKVNVLVDGAINNASDEYFDRAWYPKEFSGIRYLFALDDMVFVFETFRRWLLNYFFKDTSKYEGLCFLNRHLFAHGLDDSWQQITNFKRLLIVIVTLGVVDSWYNKKYDYPLIFPSMDKGSELLWQRALFAMRNQQIIKSIEEKIYHENGRLVPHTTMDDGILLRKELLAKDCVEDLMKPLRNKGWSVSTEEPSADGLYILVKAESGSLTLNIALLYSCATDNAIYQELSTKCSVILYRDAPYKQNIYARNIKVHVGPVSGWQPPSAQ